MFGFHDDLEEGCEMIVKALGTTQPKTKVSMRSRCWTDLVEAIAADRLDGAGGNHDT